MNRKATAVGRYNFTSQDKLFLDANIWLYLFGPQKPRAYWVNIYSKVFSNILSAKSQIYIDALVVSEFINRYARVKQKVVAPQLDFSKGFRNSPDFKPIAKDIAADVKRVLNYCTRIENGFETLDIGNLLTDYATGNFDFNDQVITEICKSNGFTFITNDSDFKTREIPILTANQSLLGN